MEIPTYRAKFCMPTPIRHAAIRASVLLLCAPFLLNSCVTERQYRSLEQQKSALEQQLAARDSTPSPNNPDALALQETKRDYSLALRQIEQLRATNLNLNQSYQELLTRFGDLSDRNRDLLATSSEAQQNLRGQADQRLLELQEKSRQLQALETQLGMREQRLRDLESSYGKTLEVRNQEFSATQEELIAQEERNLRLQNTLNTILATFVQREALHIQSDAQGVRLRIPKTALFNPNGTQLTPNGKILLKAITETIQSEQPLEIMILGHTDNAGNPPSNWESSLQYAYLAGMELIQLGISPERITIGGKGQFQPQSDNSSRNGREQNQRVELILRAPTALQNNLSPAPNPRE